jgi:cation/acetate symporter
LALVASGFSYSCAVEAASAEELTTVVEHPDGTEGLEVVASRLDHGPARFSQPGARYGAGGHFALVVTLIAGTAGLPHVMNRFFTSPTGRAARMTTVWVLGMVGLFYTLAVMLGTAARAVVSERVGSDDGWLAGLTVDGVLRVPEHALLSLGRLYGGDAGLSVVTTGALLAIMSTIGGLLLAASASWGHDVYERHLNPRATRVQALRAGQLAVVVVAVGAAGAAGLLNPAMVSASTPSVIASLVTAAFALAGCTLTPCLVLGIWWKRTTAPAVMIGMVVGAVLSLGAILVGMAGADLSPVLQTPTFAVGPMVSLVIVGVSLLTAPVDGIDDIWVRMHGSAQDRAAERIARITIESGIP